MIVMYSALYACFFFRSMALSSTNRVLRSLKKRASGDRAMYEKLCVLFGSVVEDGIHYTWLKVKHRSTFSKSKVSSQSSDTCHMSNTGASPARSDTPSTCALPTVRLVLGLVAKCKERFVQTDSNLAFVFDRFRDIRRQIVSTSP